MARFEHPELADVSLAQALHALADPARLAIVARLAECADLSCSAAAPCPDLPKSTRSHHFNVLRAAGLVETEAAGREARNRLRRAEFDARFPGLLDAVLRPEACAG